MLRTIRTLNRFSATELLVLVQLSIFSLIAMAGLRFLPLPRIIDFLARCANFRWSRHLPVFQNRCDARQLTRLAGVAARITRGGGPCLMRSLVLFWLLKARGEAAQLVIGVSKEASALNGHAWIECHGRILADSAEMTASFARLLRF